MESEEIARPAVERERKTAGEERGARTTSVVEPVADTGIPSVRMATHTTQSEIPPGAQTAAVRQEAVPDAAPATDNGPSRPEVKPELKPEIQPASAHDIKLEVSGGEQRVELRLSERGGEVRVAVRTTDSHLAGALRENLPELTTRFAETGLRSEIWRPSATPGGSHSQEGDSQSRGQGGNSQQDSEQRQARSSPEEKIHKEKGKDFAWLMSSLR